MGQQQLLLVILVTIIVGIATVVAINTFSASAESANLDAARQDAANIASSAQSFFLKPTLLGGGGQNFTNVTFRDITFASDSISADGLTALNANGVYIISGANATQFTLTVHPASRITGAPALTSTSSNEMVGTVIADNFTWTDPN